MLWWTLRGFGTYTVPNALADTIHNARYAASYYTLTHAQFCDHVWCGTQQRSAMR